MSMPVLPKSRLGKWSVGSGITSILLFAAWRIGLGWEPRSTSVPIINWALLFYAAVLTCMAALVTGLVSIFASKERTLLVLLTTLLGLLVLIYGLVIILFAHGA
jgi:hypothetical protein